MNNALGESWRMQAAVAACGGRFEQASFRTCSGRMTMSDAESVVRRKEIMTKMSKGRRIEEGGIDLPEIRDSIHGFIELSDEEMEIVDSAPFQRLRRIRHLATTYLIYPSAEHTRFPHSLGVMHVATLIFDKVIQKQKRDGVLDWSKDEIAAYRQMLRLAALLHDVGHGPFSHSGDHLFHPSVGTHERMSAKIVEESELAAKIDRIGRAHGFNAKNVAALIKGVVFKAEEQLLTRIFASELDADKMDYLLRDSLFAGVKYGYFDLERILNVVNLFPKEGTWFLGFESDGIEAVEGLILARYFMFKQVYLHRTRRI